MNLITKFFNWLFSTAEQQERVAMERYLSQSQNVFELEARQRDIDQNRRGTSFF